MNGPKNNYYRRVNGPKLRTSRRARSSTGRQHGRQVSTTINGYPRVQATRSSSAHPFNTDKYAVQVIFYNAYCTIYKVNCTAVYMVPPI